MGFKVSAVLARCEADVLVDALDMSVRGIEEEMPDDCIWCAKLLSTGWSVVYANDFEFAERVRDRAMRLSGRVPVFDMSLHEGVMFSQVRRYGEDATRWRVEWEVEHGPVASNPSVSGKPPASLAASPQRAADARGADAEVDHYFEVSLEALSEETGFRHDVLLRETDVDAFRILEKKPGQVAGFFSRPIGAKG